MRPIDGVLRSLGVVGLLIGFTFSCGNDTASDPDDDDGSGGTASDAGGTASDAGGSGGTGGSDGTGDNGGSGGSAGPSTTGGSITGAGGMSTAAGVTSTTSSPSTTGAAGAINLPETTPGLAEPCSSDDDCESDLICVAADSNSLLVGGPANGLCTSPCGDDSPCALDAACILFGEMNGYCMPTCVPYNGVQDCAGRDDVVCDVLPVGRSCTTNTECAAGTACLDESECVLPVCLPKCGADSDCPEGRFCDRSYGECVAEAPEGKGLNELCDDSADPDECLGFCAGDADTDARCLETCALGVYPACGSESTESGTADCLIPYVGIDDGDLGFCVGLCDCNADCPDEGMVCLSFESVELEPPIQGRIGFCAPMSDEVDEADVLETCE